MFLYRRPTEPTRAPLTGTIADTRSYPLIICAHIRSIVIRKGVGNRRVRLVFAMKVEASVLTYVMLEQAFFLTRPITIFNGVTLVMIFLPFGKIDLKLNPAFFPIHGGGDNGVAFTL